MNISLRYSLLLLALPLLALRCDKDDPPYGIPDCEKSGDPEACEVAKLPPVTTSGANTFAALVDGKAWLSKGGGRVEKPKISSDYYRGLFVVSGKKYGFSNKDNLDNQILESITVSTEGYSGGGVYVFEKDTLVKGRYNNHEGNCLYGSSSFVSGELEIMRFDTIVGIASGTFSFKIFDEGRRWDGSPDPEVCDTVHITHGRFDVKIWE